MARLQLKLEFRLHANLALLIILDGNINFHQHIFSYIFILFCFTYFLSFWPGLGLPRPKAIVVIPQNQPLPKHLRKKTSKSAKHACHYATKERPVKITMYLGLDIIIKIKFTTIFDRCATLNVLNYLTKNFES